ncbi:MAG: MMPL family transporter [Gammaproteobacteria bacterium]|nr:MMPL family transporter [Gammaproteobacteria bacterium]
MPFSLSDTYNRSILGWPRLTLLLIACITGFFAYHASNFRLDASADSLVLENDEALQYYRAIKARYGSDDFLIITYTPNQELFSEQALENLRALRDELVSISRIASVVTILDVPLIQSPPVTLGELETSINTLEDPATDPAAARQELITSPIYSDLLISSDGQTTALQLKMQRDETWHRLLTERDRLREKKLRTELSEQENVTLWQLTEQFQAHNADLQDQLSRDIAEVRSIMAKHRAQADLYLGGIPMITADSIDFVRHDLLTFGIGVLCFLVIILAVAFRKPRWVLLPMLTCFAAGLILIGYLGLSDWPVTVVSSNFISLLLIITLSLTVHLIVRYRELHRDQPQAPQHTLVLETVKSKALPCLYTAITTMVAFGSLLVSDIRPVIDFGWMMAIGIAVAFTLTFTLFPAALLLLKPGQPTARRDITGAITHFFARQNDRHARGILIAFAVFTLLSLVGMGFLTVENRFIDYYKESTEIYQGMELIDRKLGGTTPLDVVIDAPADFFAAQNEALGEADEFLEELSLELEGSSGITGTSYWFNSYKLKEVSAIHDMLDELPESGKVLSISSAMRLLESLNERAEQDDFFLAIIYKRLPEMIKQALFDPYLADDGNQIRFSLRVFESDASLQREELLHKIRRQLQEKFDLKTEQVHLTGMVVLYNNLLQSLFQSQILTIGVVFVAIMLMFAMLFRNLQIAAIAIIPNMVAAALVLGLMGWLGIPLDIMTITIAAIVIGIAVDNTIHYIHRFRDEVRKDGDYPAAMQRSHASIGRAMYYTTVTITLGFSILALSNFIPTIYFGLLTGFSMIVALLADLTLLPLLLVRFKPVKT